MKQKYLSFFQGVALLCSELSNCLDKQVGAVLVRDNMIIATGYNGTSKGVLNCGDGGCLRCQDNKKNPSLDDCICIHAELNCINQCALNGICTKDSIMIVSLQPCNNCLKNLINAGVKEVYYIKSSLKKINPELLKKIKVIRI